MPTITLKITIDVPDGATVRVETTDIDTASAGIPAEVLDRINRLVPSRFRPNVIAYLEAVIALDCTVEVPDSERREEYVNIYPPARCRRSRAASIYYASSRTAVWAGTIELDDFDLAEKTFNGHTYAYPKVPHLENAKAVEEATRLTEMAIQRLER
ncbi:MAG: hypothetical protein JWN62_3669 [Acidimicrobiales bacterium]|nr:hypothetical protein [Acidimicrobiales bacterium]